MSKYTSSNPFRTSETHLIDEDNMATAKTDRLSNNPFWAPERPAASTKPLSKSMSLNALGKDKSEAQEKTAPATDKTPDDTGDKHAKPVSKPKTDASGKPKSRRHKSRRAATPLDVIDKLDVTGFFGPGSFHHDGPFDACTPHRNKSRKQGPVAAFPVDGANNSLLAAPTGLSADDLILGRTGDEAYMDFSNGINSISRQPDDSSHKNSAWPRAQNPASLQASRSEVSLRGTMVDGFKVGRPVHGAASAGLGTSTFLDGAPAPRSAYKAQEAHAAAQPIGRKKSLKLFLKGASAEGPARPVKPEFPRRPGLKQHQSSGNAPLPVLKDVQETGEPLSKTVSWSGSDTAAEAEAFPPKDSPSSSGDQVSNLLKRVRSLRVGKSRRQ